LFVANAVIAGLILLLVHRLLSIISTPLVAFVGTMTVVLVFAFGHYGDNGTYNFLFPYSHEMTHGIVLSFAAMLCFWKFLTTERLRFVAATGLLVGMVFLTKPEIFAAIAAAIVVGLVAVSWLRPRVPYLAVAWATCLGCAALVPLAAFGLFSLAMPPRDALVTVLGGFNYVTNDALRALPYYRGVMGIDDVPASLRRIGIWLGVYALALAPIWFDARRRPPHERTMLAPLGAFLIVALLCWWWFIEVWSQWLSPLPLVLAAAALWRAYTLFRAPDAATRPVAILQLVTLVFSLALLPKVVLEVQVMHYGFVLALPGTLVVLVIVLDWIPADLNRRGGTGRIFQAAWFGFLVVFVGTSFWINDAFLSRKTYQLGSGGDAFWTYPEIGREVDATLKQLANEAKPGETLVVMPEGAMVNYLARIENPTQHLYFMPGEIAMFGEDAMLASLEAHPPDWICMVPKDLTTWGAPHGFGVDTGVRLWAWVRDNYQPIDQPPKDRKFHMRLMRRNAK
jgi:hypothetical protein